jgi:hypothetical protein
LVDGVTAGRAQFVDLRVVGLLLGGDAGVADETMDRRGRGAFGAGHGRLSGEGSPVVQ